MIMIDSFSFQSIGAAVRDVPRAVESLTQNGVVRFLRHCSLQGIIQIQQI